MPIRKGQFQDIRTKFTPKVMDDILHYMQDPETLATLNFNAHQRALAAPASDALPVTKPPTDRERLDFLLWRLLQEDGMRPKELAMKDIEDGLCLTNQGAYGLLVRIGVRNLAGARERMKELDRRRGTNNIENIE